MSGLRENSIKRFDGSENDDREFAAKKRSVKDAYRVMKVGSPDREDSKQTIRMFCGLQEGFEYLEASASKPDGSEFRDARVANLWAEVEQGNFTDVEKNSFKVNHSSGVYRVFSVCEFVLFESVRRKSCCTSSAESTNTGFCSDKKTYHSKVAKPTREEAASTRDATSTPTNSVCKWTPTRKRSSLFLHVLQQLSFLFIVLRLIVDEEDLQRLASANRQVDQASGIVRSSFMLVQ